MSRSVNELVRFHAALLKVEPHVLPGRVAPADSSVVVDHAEAEEQRTSPPTTNDHLSELMEALGARVGELVEGQQQNLAELQALVVELSLAVGSHIVKQTLDANQLNLNELVRNAIEQLLPASQLRVRINPMDHVDLEKIVEGQQPNFLDKIQVVSDSSLMRGTCFVESEAQGLLGTLEDRLETVRDTLLQGIDYARTERRKTQGNGAQLQRFPDRRKPA